MRPLFRVLKPWATARLMLVAILMAHLIAYGSSHESSPSYRLNEITNHSKLLEILDYACQQRQPHRASLFIMFAPPETLWANQAYRCGDNKVFEFSERRPPIGLPVGLFDQADEAWLLEAYRLIQQGTYSLMGEWIRPKNPRDISFLHRAFAKYPYITARLMATAPAPHVGEVWQGLYQHMDRVLKASQSLDDKRLLAFAMARDGRVQQALAIIEELLGQGDQTSLYLLPYVTLDVPQAIDDEMADTTEPLLGYQVLAMLENYVYQQNYPAGFCQWALGLTPGPLADYVATVLGNIQDNLRCKVGK
ncbi:hypothetical protein KJY73_17835 [Bowmanella sp. Y26]|uniref:hypothetical protein n=1 Tax=Bowmanella yangjiangensis TaxID=2811230 RepID=UPI001BDC5BE1|nr:hypothetical protein [Bowmanella yangjiangensis]MBT1065453.1 hypothetical protein [Bowmanella yangjiangensis]